MVQKPTLILCYHRVNKRVDDPFHLCVSPGRFAQHLKLLSRKASFATLDEAIQPANRPRVVLTFDDGYADNLLQAAPIARQLGVPMTVYVTSGMVGEPGGFWWDRLARLVQHGCTRVVDVRLTIRQETITTRLGPSAQPAQVIDELRERLRPCSAEEIEGVLRSLAEQLAVDGAAPPDARPLTTDELRQLNDFADVTIGAHTTQHVQLLNQSFDAQLDAIGRSKRDLESAVQGEVRHFAYPFGGVDSFDESSVAAVRQAGFVTATTTIPGSVGRWPDPLRLRRRLVMNWPPWRFRAQMLRWGLY
jgi:peptidoglycan/xylan/chitin deacetylase (PgdA/CDA1 family)